MNETLRIGIAGAGKIVFSEHAPRFRAIDGVEIVAVANQTPESTARAAAALGISRTYRHWGELIEDDEIDAVMVGTWPYLHAPIVIEALYAGKHVLTEARMSTDGESAAAMADAALEVPGLVAQVVPASFSVWADRAICRVIASGEIGRLAAVRVGWDGGTGTNPAEWWRWQRRYSGNNIMALGILVESMGRWLGFAEWVTAETALVSPRKPAPDRGPVPTDVPDHVIVVAGYPGDVTATIEMSTVSLRGAGIKASFFGSDGTLEADFGAQSLAVRKGDAVDATPVQIAPEEHDEWRAERDFVASIREGRPVEMTDFDTGRRYMDFIDAVHASNRQGQRIVLEA